MLSTRFTDLVGCRVPIQLAPMGVVGTSALAEAVASAGGHAMLPLVGVPPAVAERLLDELDQRAVQPRGVNFLVPFLDREVLELAAARVGLVDFYLAPPDRELVDAVHAAGALAAWQVCSLEEAVAAEEAGCDLIVAHGIEAGGRNPGGIGLIPLLAQVLDRVSVPVVAAGGIATGRGVAAALAMGADGARMGTRFIATPESGAHPDYVAAVLAAGPHGTLHTNVFDMPPQLTGARILRSAVEAAQAAADEVIGTVAVGGERQPVRRFQPSPPGRETTGNVAAMALYAGQSAGSVHRIQPAAEIVAEVTSEAEKLLSRRSAEGADIRSS